MALQASIKLIRAFAVRMSVAETLYGTVGAHVTEIAFANRRCHASSTNTT